LQEPGGYRAAPADGVCVEGGWRTAHDQQREEEQRDPRQSGRAARQGAQVVLDAAGDEEDGDEEPVAQRVQFGAEDGVARGIAVDEVERRWSTGRSACISETFHVQFLVLKKSRESAGGWLVKTMTYSESRAHYAETLNAVVDDREEVVITRAGHEPVVIVALADYESLKETAYLLRSPENARRLLASIDRLEHGGGIERDLLE
jgi:antitoxin YefM